MKILKDLLVIAAIIIISYLLFLFSLKYQKTSEPLNYLNPLGLEISTFYIKNGMVKLGILNPSNKTYIVYFNYLILKTEFGSNCAIYPATIVKLAPFEENIWTFDLRIEPQCKNVYVQTKKKGTKVIVLVSYEEANGTKMGTIRAVTIT